MEKLHTLSNAITSLLENPTVEAKENTSDRVSATTTVNTGNLVQSAIPPGAPLAPSFETRDPYNAMAYDINTANKNLAKLVTIGDPVDWSNTQARGTRLKFCELPKALAYPIDMPGHAQAIYFSHIRTNYHFCVQVNAAMGCAGSLLVVYAPDICNLEDLAEKSYFDGFMNLPHTIINLATTTQGELFIPHVSHLDFVEVNSNRGGRIGIYIWTPLQIPEGGPSTLSVTLLGAYVNPNYQCPKVPTSNQGKDQDFTQSKQGGKELSMAKYKPNKFKWSRELINIAEGPGSMNLSNRQTTNGAQSFALVGERAILDPRVAGSVKRVEDLVDILKIPSCRFQNTMALWTGTAANKELITALNLLLTDWVNFKQVANGFKYYRGSLVLHVSVFNSTFNRGRCRVCFYPLHPPTGGTAVGFDNSRNSINQICDIGLNSEFKITIPYTSTTWMRRLDESVGRLSIFVENKLTYTAACANSIHIVLSLSAGDDFQLYVPNETIYTLQSPGTWGSTMDLTDPLDDSNNSIMEQNNGISFESSSTIYAQGEGIAAEVGLASTENKGPQDRIIRQNQPKFLNFETCAQKVMMVSHSKVDNYFGRAARILNLDYNTNNAGTVTIPFPNKSHLSLMKFFAYFNGEFNLHIVNQSNGFLSVAHAYDQYRLSDFSTSLGCVLIPPGEAMTVCVPFYSNYVFRNPVSQWSNDPGNLGTMIYKPEALSGTIIAFLSFRNPNLLFPLPPRKPATVRDMLTRNDLLLSIHSFAEAEDLAEKAEEDPDQEYVKPEIEYRNPIATYLNNRTGYRVEKLLCSGDIESNPGPYQPFPSAVCDLSNQAPQTAMAAPSHVVFRNRGFYRHYGLRHGDWVYHLTSENVASSALNGTATFTKSPSDGWKTAFPIHVDYFTANNLENMVGSSHIFSCDSNCETIIRDLFPGTPWVTQSQALALAGGIILCATTLGYISTTFSIHDLKEMFTMSQQGEESAMHTMVQKCMSYFSNIFMETFASDIIKVLVKASVRLLCYVVMYCHSPNLLTTMCLGTLIIMDVTQTGPLSEDTKGVLKSLVEGDIRGFAESVVSHLQFDDSEEDSQLRQNTVKAAKQLIEMPSLSNEGPADFIKGFNSVSQAGKHIDWWIQMFKRVYEFLKSVFAPSEHQKIIQWFDDNSELISNFLTTVNNHITSMKRPEVAKNAEFQQQHIWLSRRLNELTTLVVKSATHSPLANTITRLCYEMHKVKLPQPAPSTTIRMEPVGVWICGEPGQGKSFMTQALIKKIQKKKGYVGVFTNPTGSEFMDSYAQQEIHVIDDAGQNRDELDLKLLCQCISSIPFNVPMASLEEKGMSYTSKLVIATSNRSDFITTVLADPNALKRRFPFYLRIRAKKQYVKDNKIDVALSLPKMPYGDPWESSTDGYTWKPVDLEQLADDIVEELNRREDGVRRWKQVLSDESPSKFKEIEEILEEYTGELEDLADQWYSELCGSDSPFDSLTIKPQYKLEKATKSIKDWLRTKIKAIKRWASKNMGWLTLCSIFATGLSMIATVAIFKGRKEENQRAYNPQTTNPKGGKVFQNNPIKPYVLSNEAPYNSEIEHLFQNVCYINAPEYNGPIHCLALCGRKVVTYGHVESFLNDSDKPYIVHKGLSHQIQKATVSKVSSDGRNMDLVVITIHDLPYQFKDVRKYLAKSVSNESFLLWDAPVGRIMYEVNHPYMSGVNISRENTLNAESITYSVKSKKGMCGGVLISRIEGNFKIVGMHIAGNGVVGCAAMLHGLKQVSNEGQIICKAPTTEIVHQPTKTTLHPNHLYGVWPVEMGPSVTSPNDKRLEIKTSSIIKMNAESKYPGNVFNVNRVRWEHAVTNVAVRMQKIIGINGFTDMLTAVEGFDKFNHIDLNTSAGLKYTKKGLTKRDLISYNPTVLSPLLVKDVEEMMEDLLNGKSIKTTFATYMKDELRKIMKIKTGQTRLIEACSLDYVVCHRMVMAKIYNKIYEAPAQVIGCAVGINPWTDFDMLVKSLFKFNYCFDFSKWDGSLPPQLLDAGTYVLAMCHTHPQVVQDLMKPIINSEQICLDEINYVEGGMPSGAPCTTVINSVCNLIICEYAALTLNTPHNAITYGDDLIFSTPEEINSNKVCEIWHEELGLIATAADKTTNVKPVIPLEIEFLKRRPKFLQDTSYIVGSLDLNSMLQHIMWSKSSESFEQQLVSFENELVLHGKDVYNDVYNHAEPALRQAGIYMTTFELAYRRMIPCLFE